MYNAEFTNRFKPCLKDIADGKFKSWVERGLKEDAPEDAKKAFEEFLNMEAESKKTMTRY